MRKEEKASISSQDLQSYKDIIEAATASHQPGGKVDMTSEQMQNYINATQQAAMNGTYQPTQSGLCPHCGYCPHCGRGGQHTWPYQPYWPYTPWVTSPTITWGTTTGGLASGIQSTIGSGSVKSST